MPAFLASLPRPLRKASEWSVERFRDVAASMGLGVRVDAPAFVEIEQTQVAAHVSQGPFVLVSLRLKTRSLGDWRGNLVVHLKGGAYGVTNIIVPVSAKVTGAASSTFQAVLIVETPYELYATGKGSDFEPLAALNSRLAGRGMRVDYCRQLPRSLSIYLVILLGGSELAGLGQVEIERLRSFVAGGGRLILAADAFFGNTASKANQLLGSYGLQIVNRDAGQAITNSRIVPDSLTSRVKGVDFWRPAQINVTDQMQGRLLVEAEDGQGGYVAVSPASVQGRGDRVDAVFMVELDSVRSGQRRQSPAFGKPPCALSNPQESDGQCPDCVAVTSGERYAAKASPSQQRQAMISSLGR